MTLRAKERSVGRGVFGGECGAICCSTLSVVDAYRKSHTAALAVIVEISIKKFGERDGLPWLVWRAN